MREVIFNNPLWQNKEKVKKNPTHRLRDARLARQSDPGKDWSIGPAGWMREAKHQEREPPRVVGSPCSLLPFGAGCQ